MKQFRKRDFPLESIRRFLEPGPILLVSSAWKDETNIMTMGWHMMMGFRPALFGCYIWEGNHSHGLIRRSRECVVNLPTTDLLDTVVDIGNCSGAQVDKFQHFGLTALPATHVSAPMIGECHANFECRLFESRNTSQYKLFIWEVIKAHVAILPKLPEMMHYRGDGKFMVSGKEISRRSRFKPENL